jgi:hypothetical protein
VKVAALPVGVAALPPVMLSATREIEIKEEI